ncbi:nucleoporin protein Ndc1-Nup-domain-containing protein [Mycena epipterygia]|nr:nucleoporin protein Ndc1-Nup-domain-containing protein [Mycena epipterygia]
MATNLTPIRAITTPLRSSAAPPIPPASQLYEPLAKAVLRRRLTNRIFLYTSIISVLGTALWLAWIGRFDATRFIAASVAIWAGGMLPVVLLRKFYLTVTRTSAASPLLLVQKSLAPPLSARTVRAVQTHVLSALCVLAVHAAVDPTLHVFIKSRKHPYTPHPMLVLLALSQCTLAALYVLRAVMRDVWVFPFRRPTLTPSPGAILAPVFLPLIALPIALFTLFIVLPILRRIPIVSLLLRPIRSPHASVLLSLGRGWTLGLQTAGMWEAAAGVWGWSIGEPLHTTPAVRALVSGISVATTPAPTPSASSSAFSTPSSLLARSSVPSSAPPAGPPPPTSIYTHLAYAELLALASSSDAGALKARAEAFDVDGTVWARLAREALILIGREYRVLLARGAPPLPPPPAPAAAPAAPVASTSALATPSRVTPAPLLKQNIFAKSTPPSPAARVGAALASGGALEEIVQPAVEGLVSPIPVPDWRQYVALVVPDWRRYVPGVPAWVPRYAELSLPRAWTQARRGRAVAGWVPRREVCVSAIGVLTHLTAASLAEDRFGVVQHDIPRILEALLAFLGEVEEAQAGLRPEADKAAPEEAADLEEARAVLGEVGDALKEGIARIVRTFGDKLRAFRFPPRTAARLQGFVDYCA